MRVILKDNIETLGQIGKVVDVRPGYARNFLIPRGLAVVADEGKVAQMKHELKVAEDKARKVRASAELLAKQLKDLHVEIRAKAGEGGKLFGSVGAADIAEAVHKKGFAVIDRRDIKVASPIKQLGDFRVPVRVHHELSVEILVTVAPEETPDA
ncbi:MAG: 50S ribosomal protein L9 [Deltaproteobacteria bacterium]|nr:50S ribosomal protein L9 [Deltaproteobacteria bacterium]